MKTILVIEDEEGLSDLMISELESEGYKAISAKNGQEGLDKLQEFEPDLVICDRAMPNMTGHQLLERIRNIYPQYRDLPFVFLSALTSDDHKQEVAHLKAAAYLEKPIDFDVLFDVIKKNLPAD